jgi:hypothetical protein
MYVTTEYYYPLYTLFTMAEQNFSAALSTWKGKLRLLRRLNKLTTRDQPLGAAEVARLHCSRAGREPKGEYGGKEEAGRADKGSVPARDQPLS